MIMETIDRLNRTGLVSVIIPVFNVRPYLVEALDSVLHQTYTNLEIIIIDDGSTDGSGAICDEYAKKDARVLVIHQENNGLSTARNVGLDRMSGDAVAFLDSDDAYHPDYVKTMMETMVREKADMVICRYTTHCTTGKMRCTGREQLTPSIAPGIYNRADALRALSEETLNVSVWNKLYKKELWNTIRFLDGHVYEDGETSYKITNLCQKVYVLATPLYLYRERPGSITGTWSRDNLNDLFLTFSRIDSFIKMHMPSIFTEKQWKKSRQSRINVMIVCYIRIFGIDEIDIKAFGEILRNQIIETTKEIGIANCGLKTMIAYQMMLYCPWLLRIVYPLYHPARMFVRNHAGI